MVVLKWLAIWCVMSFIVGIGWAIVHYDDRDDWEDES